MTTNEVAEVCRGRGAHSGYHHIEEAAIVYLHPVADGTGWEICDATMGKSLFSHYEDTGPLNEVCECDDHEECEHWRERFDMAALPDPEELLRMLADKLGFDVVARATA